MSERQRTTVLDRLMAAREPAGFTLPTAVEDAWRTYQTVQAMSVPPAPTLVHPQDAADQLVDAVHAGQDVDPLALSQETARNRAAAHDVDGAQDLLNTAAGVAANRCTALVAAAADEIITEHLRLVFTALLDEARKVSIALGGYDITEHRALRSAPPRVRAAADRADQLAGQRTLLTEAWGWVNMLSERQPENDDAGMFATFRLPYKLWPGWTPAERPRPIGWPEDMTARTLWLAGPGAVAEPWMPTSAERDEAWASVYAETVQKQRGHQVAARAAMGVPV
jgi:hypothetical protein